MSTYGSSITIEATKAGDPRLDLMNRYVARRDQWLKESAVLDEAKRTVADLAAELRDLRAEIVEGIERDAEAFDPIPRVEPTR